MRDGVKSLTAQGNTLWETMVGHDRDFFSSPSPPHPPFSLFGRWFCKGRERGSPRALRVLSTKPTPTMGGDEERRPPTASMSIKCDIKSNNDLGLVGRLANGPFQTSVSVDQGRVVIFDAFGMTRSEREGDWQPVEKRHIPKWGTGRGANWPT